MNAEVRKVLESSLLEAESALRFTTNTLDDYRSSVERYELKVKAQQAKVDALKEALND